MIDKINVNVYKDGKEKIAADLALKNHLYVSGWCLSNDLKRIRDGLDSATIVLLCVNDDPTCVVVQSLNEVAAFCRKAQRKKGYASRCLRRLNTKGSMAGIGIKGSREFWEKNGIGTGARW